jgi:prepilin peptidase CpaA
MTNLIPLLEFSCAIAIVALLCHAAAHDLAARTVPNIDCAAIALLGLLQRLLTGGVFAALLAAAAAFLLGHALWRRGLVGGGDVKMIAACCLVVPMARVPLLICFMLCAGGVLACAYLLAGTCLRRRPPSSAPARSLGLARLLRLEAWRARRGRAVPYAVAVATGTLLAMGGA